jgi:hypothetical protein
MPTLTSLSGAGLTNLGPLTTTFIPPASCVQSNAQTMFGPSTPNVLPYGFISCDDLDNERECLPSPSKVATETAPPYTQAVNYFSPGIFCPAGWTTAGTAAMPVSGGPTAPPEVSGAFKFNKDGAVEYIGHRDHVLLADALVPGETAVECCPRLVVPRAHDLRPVLTPNTTYSSMTPMMPGGGSCYSTLPSYTISQTCRVDYPEEAWSMYTTKARVNHAESTEFYPATVSKITGTMPPLTTTDSHPSTSDYIAMLVAEPVLMVHRPSDLTATAFPTSTSDMAHRPSDLTATTSATSTSNIAARGGPRLAGAHWGDSSALLGFVTAMTVGVVMVVL